MRNGYFRGNWSSGWKNISCTLGEEFDTHLGLAVFIRSTRKGFNFFVPSRNRLLRLKGHFYDRKFSHVEIPRDRIHFKVSVPDWFSYSVKRIKHEKPKEFYIGEWSNYEI